LRGVPLSIAQLRDRHGQGYQAGDQRGRDQRCLPGDLAGQCQQPGRGTQLGSFAGGPGICPYRARAARS
jgi:hypothetical protein